MKKFDQGNLSEAKLNQKVRILSGPIADYNKIWTVTEKHNRGIRLQSKEIGNPYPIQVYFFQMECEIVEIEIA